MNRSSDLGLQSQKLVLGVITFVMLIAIAFLTTKVIENDSGSISAAVGIIGGFLALWAAIRPKMGLYIVTFEAYSLDYVKKIAVYYGASSQDTVIQVLVVGMLAVVGTVVGIFVQGTVLRAFKMRGPQWAVLIGAGLVALVVFIGGYRINGFVKSGENAFNSGAYIALALPIMVLITDWDEINKLLKLQFWLTMIWAVWGIKQYYFGFTDMEWYYADTGLSATASEHMYFFADPRPFGFGSGMSNYFALSSYLCYGAWVCWHVPQERFKYGLGSLIIFWGVVTSMQRTMLLLPLMTVVFYFCFRTKGRTIFIYASVLLTFITTVLFSDKIFDYFNDINDAIKVSGRWGESVLTVNTFSDRLNSYQMLLKPSSWSLFGIDSTIIVHDGVTKILLSYGAVGLGTGFVLIALGCYFLHRTLLRIADEESRNYAIFMVAVIIPAIAVGLAGTGNIDVTPVNLQIWSFFGVAVTIIVHSESKKAVVAVAPPMVRRPAGLSHAVYPSPVGRLQGAARS